MDNQFVSNYKNWNAITDQLTYPRPQGNVPMFLTLKNSKQKHLEHSYFSVLNLNE
jgi:hypothetical protein